MIKFFGMIIISLYVFTYQPVFAQEKSKNDYVILLHGITQTSKNMEPMATYLSEQGYDVVNITYPSTRYPLETIIEKIHATLNKTLLENKTVHFVGHSMGGLVIRGLIHKYRPLKLGRVVHLGTPNNGSEVANFFRDYWIYKKIFGPAGQQLTTNQTKLDTVLGSVNYDLGIIAGDRTQDIFSSQIIPGKDDGKVSVKSTKIKGMKEHIVIHTSHLFLPNKKEVQKQTVNFIKKGHFIKTEN